MLTVFFAFLALFLLSVGLLIAISPGKPNPILDESGKPVAGAVVEKIRVEINGSQQGMFIQSTDTNHPVLLFLHGGPGLPEYFLTEQYPTGLEKIFTVVWWDQRGAGLSFAAGSDPATMTTEQMITDTIALTNYLHQRFGQEKIYLLGHSGGSFLGIQVAARAPELYHAYIGMGQLTYQLQSEMLAYDYMLEQYKQRGDTAMLRELEKARPTLDAPLPASYDRIRDDAMHKLGIGTTRDMGSIVTGVFFPSWRSPQFTLAEKVDFWRGKVNSRRQLRNAIFATDLTQQVKRLDLPVYFFEGRYDYTCSYTLARAYFDKLQAPLKGFYTFENSAHSPIFEEPEKSLKILLEDVLNGTNALRDKK